MKCVITLPEPETDLSLHTRAAATSKALLHHVLGPVWRVPGLGRVRALHKEIRSRLTQACALEHQPPEHYGFIFDTAVQLYVVTGILYRWYFRARCIGIEKLPPSPLLLVANHGSHSLSWDGANILSACLLDAEIPRLVRPMANHRLMELPIIGWAARRIGAVDGQRSLCIDLMRSGATILTFPEGTDALIKPFRRRYELAPFHQGFMHVALATGAPIVPVAVIGSEEEAPLLFNAPRLARLVRTPVAPITPTLVVPLPVRYGLHFGTPMYFNGLGTHSEITQAVESVRSALHDLLQEGLRARHSRIRNWKSTFPFGI